jgi:FkbM family methyltransferase
MSLRGMAEKLSRGIVLRRRLPSEFHHLPIYVSPECGLSYWRSDLANADPLLFRMAKESVRPGAAVWDVGANLGLFSFASAVLAGPAGSVLAIEPDLWLAQLIGRTAKRWSTRHFTTAPVRVLCAAIADTNGISRLQIAQRSRAANSLAGTIGSPQAQGVRAEQQTVTLTLDFLLEHFPHPSVVKIDVESAELKVLLGASKLLQDIRPIIFCEVLTQNSQAVGDLFTKFQYRMYPAQVEADQRKPAQKAPVNTLAIPEELAAEGPMKAR